MGIKILSSSTEIRSAIKQIFSGGGQRRVAITAFVGDESHAYLPNPKNLELHCWAKAGGTNPAAIRELIQRGVKVYFSDSLHMKLYWSNKGFVVTSANLSTYALGAGGLKEFGVLLPASTVNINKIIRSIKAHIASEKEIATLEQEHKRMYRTNPSLFIKSVENYSFTKWYRLKRHKKGGDWKLASFVSRNVKLSNESKQMLQKEHGNLMHEDMLEIYDNKYAQDDWLLCYEFKGRRPIGIKWFYAHHVVKSSRKVKGRKESYSQVIQVNKLKAYDKPPFEIDASFKRAFSLAHKEYYKNNADKMDDDSVPTAKFLALISSQVYIS